ncbi:MAG: helix-turn-helix transcriptional regulator [Burkholderiaceae bacterium]|nr:helix-turn-helix transcriptional regulator [Burkholderiaceae bacterium]
MKSFAALYRKSYDSPVFLAEQLKIAFLAEVKAQMDAQGVSASELARRIGTTPAYISKLFRGPANVSAETMAKLAHALDCRVHVHLASMDASVRWFDLLKNLPAERLIDAEPLRWDASYLEGVREKSVHVEAAALAA